MNGTKEIHMTENTQKPSRAKKKKNAQKTARAGLRWGRNLVQLAFFLLSPALFSQAFGGLKDVFTSLGTGSVLTWTMFSVRLVFLLALTIVFGRIFCGWACAFGALNDWVYQISQAIQKKTGKRFPEIPEKALPVLQKLKYAVLVFVLLLCFCGFSAIVTKYSPWTVFSLFTAGNFAVGAFGFAFPLLLLLIAGMAVKERFFCQFLCPLGAVFSLLPELPFFKLNRRSENCIPRCQLCRKNCPVSLKFGETPIREGECIRCGRCMLNCPRKNIAPGIMQKIKTEKATVQKKN